MRQYHPRKVDDNQKEIKAALLAATATVESLHTLGAGAPDLLVGWSGWNILMEVKQPHSNLNAKERTWHNVWKGQRCTVRSEVEALSVLKEFTPHNQILQQMIEEYTRDLSWARKHYKRLISK